MTSSTVRRKKRKDEIRVKIEPLRNPADYKACEDIQRETLLSQDIDIIPVSLLLTVNRIGGILFGAYSSLGELIGFIFSIPGILDGKLTQHSCILAVRAAYRNFDVGFKLKMAQRDEALKRKISRITCAFDPMQPAHAYFALGKMGKWANVYENNFYGKTTNLMDRGLPTDRMFGVWELESSAVAKRVETGPPRRDFRKELKHRRVINRLEENVPGLLSSNSVRLDCEEESFIFEVPYNLQEIKNRDLGVAIEWQEKMRQVFHHYFKKNYMAADFWVSEQDGNLRACYLLEKRK